MTSAAYATAGDINTVAGSGSAGYSGDGGAATSAELNGPTSNFITPTGDMLIADQNNNVVRKVDHSTGNITTIAGTGTAGTTGDGGPATAAELNLPNDAETDSVGNVYITEYGGNVIRRIDHSTGIISTFAGTGSSITSGDGGPATAAGIRTPAYVRFGPTGDIFVSEYTGHVIRRIDKTTNVISTVVGQADTPGTDGDGGPATAAHMYNAYGFTWNSVGDMVLVDLQGSTLRKIDHNTGIITRIAGTGLVGSTIGYKPGLAWTFGYPSDVIYDAAGNLFIVDSGTNRILVMDPGGYVGAVAGTGNPGWTGDGGPASGATMNNPQAFSKDASGNLYVSDYFNNAIRQITAPIPTPQGRTSINFDTDNKSDISVFRPSGGTWFERRSSAGDTSVNYGASGDIPVPGDYDGDLITDQAIYRPSTGLWAIHNSSGGDSYYTFGVSGDIPVPGDYDGDGRTDIAIYRPSDGVWYTLYSNTGYTITRTTLFGGVPGDIPVPGDYNGDSFTDRAIFRPSTGTWWVHPSMSYDDDYGVNYGASGDVPLPGDFDGDGMTDIAIFRPSTGLWATHMSFSNTDSLVTYGISSDVPVPADFDGDHKTDIAVFRPVYGTWYIRQSATNTDAITTFGISSDIPLQLPYAIRHVFY